MKTSSKTLGNTLGGFALLLSLGALTLFGPAGCATCKGPSKTIGIESDPPGVRVEANGEDLGRTPTSYTARANRDGTFAGGWGDSPYVVFIAYPPEGVAGLHKQTKSFNPSGFLEKGDRVPARIMFDMHRDMGR